MRQVKIDDEDRIDPERHCAWVFWMSRHGVSPADVPIPSVIQADHAARKIRYLAIQRDADGRPKFRRWRRGWELARCWKTIQLDRVPDPFPTFTR